MSDKYIVMRGERIVMRGERSHALAGIAWTNSPFVGALQSDGRPQRYTRDLKRAHTFKREDAITTAAHAIAAGEPEVKIAKLIATAPRVRRIPVNKAEQFVLQHLDDSNGYRGFVVDEGQFGFLFESDLQRAKRYDSIEAAMRAIQLNAIRRMKITDVYVWGVEVKNEELSFEVVL